ncbi:MAG TPA: aldehyde dehydrogenase, partial [Planctomycetes bacterium]|nr:aldehyde dehydrogenase [Planctomycetota bacterium]
EINEIFRSAASTTLEEVLDFTEQPIVSSDIEGSQFSCTFDSLATMIVDGQLLKCLGWYDQGGGLSYRIVELLGNLGPVKTSRDDRRRSS